VSGEQPHMSVLLLLKGLRKVTAITGFDNFDPQLKDRRRIPRITVIAGCSHPMV